MIPKDSSLGTFIDFSLGIDDTDSLNGMCTTYLGAKLYFCLLQSRPLIQISDFPYLIRHNPNVPNRTKGNGSVVIRGKINSSLISWFQTTVLNIFYKFSHLSDDQTNPGLVIWYGSITKDLQEFSRLALWDIIEPRELNKFLSLNHVFYHYPKKINGLIGSFAGIGTILNMQDHTYELLVYRQPPYTKERKKANIERILSINEEAYNVFNCIDIEEKSIKIIPKGLDPVFCGIRGESPKDIFDYWIDIQPQPIPDFLLIFKTNQGTDAHINTTPIKSLSHPKFSSFKVINIVCKVKTFPKMEIGGHVNFEIEDNYDNSIKCYVYEPTKKFREIAMKLITGDLIEIGGNVRPANDNFPLTINIEKIKFLSLNTKVVEMNPKCPKCKKRMKSAGKNQPFRCKRCKIYLNKNEFKIKKEIKRELYEKIYLPTIDAQRHLTKPYKRIYREKKENYKEINILFWLEKIITYNNSLKTTRN